MENFKIVPIGYVKKINNDHIIEILSEFSLGLFRLETISHIFVIWWINEFDTPDARKTEKTIPRVIRPHASPQQMGTFATRSPRRPNPIGLTLVKIKSISENLIFIDHIDAYDGSPVIDIKPYLPNGDRIEEGVKLPPWFQQLLVSRPTKISD